MFKELGAFIDEVGSFTGRVFKEMLSDKDDEIMGIMEPDIDNDLTNAFVNLPGDKDEDKSEGITIVR